VLLYVAPNNYVVIAVELETKKVAWHRVVRYLCFNAKVYNNSNLMEEQSVW
jgi:hypothetical protein